MGEDAHTKLPLERLVFKSASLEKIRTNPLWIKLETVDLNEYIKWTTLDDAPDSDQSVQAAVAVQFDTRIFELGVRPGWRVLVMN